MSMVLRFNVQRASFPALYLSYDEDLRGMFWTTDPERDQPWEYSDEDEAIADAIDYGGEVFVFKRVARRSDLEFSHDSEAARIAYHFQHAAE